MGEAIRRWPEYPKDREAREQRERDKEQAAQDWEAGADDRRQREREQDEMWR